MHALTAHTRYIVFPLLIGAATTANASPVRPDAETCHMIFCNEEPKHRSEAAEEIFGKRHDHGSADAPAWGRNEHPRFGDVGGKPQDWKHQDRKHKDHEFGPEELPPAGKPDVIHTGSGKDVFPGPQPQAVPLPAAAWLLLSGLTGLALGGRRLRRCR